MFRDYFIPGELIETDLLEKKSGKKNYFHTKIKKMEINVVVITYL